MESGQRINEMGKWVPRKILNRFVLQLQTAPRCSRPTGSRRSPANSVFVVPHRPRVRAASTASPGSTTTATVYTATAPIEVA